MWHNLGPHVCDFWQSVTFPCGNLNLNLNLKKLILRFEANQWGKTIKILPRGLLREYGLPLCPRRRQITPKSLVKQLQHSAQIWTPGRNSPWRFASRNVAPVPPFTWVPRTIYTIYNFNCVCVNLLYPTYLQTLNLGEVPKNESFGSVMPE